MRSRLVYSTETGRICHKCGTPAADCTCKMKKKTATKNSRPGFPDDGTVRIKREVKGRKGKTVTVIVGIPLDDYGLKELAKELKQRCGSGGSVKDGAIIIQGDQRKTILDELKKKGYKAKIAGG